MQKLGIVILVSVLFHSSLSFGGDPFGAGKSHGSRGVVGNNGGFGGTGGGFGGMGGGFGGMGGGFGGMGGGFGGMGGGFGGMGGGMGGMGGGMGGMGGGGGAAPKKNEARENSTKSGQETIKKIEESNKQFSQSIEKLQQSFTGSLDKLTPEDKTAEYLKEINEASEKTAARTKSGAKADEIVDDIVQAIATRTETKKKQLEAVASSFTVPVAQGNRTPAGISTSDRINGLGASSRLGNPLAVAIGAEPASNDHISTPASVATEQRAFFKGAAPYNPPK